MTLNDRAAKVAGQLKGLEDVYLKDSDPETAESKAFCYYLAALEHFAFMQEVRIAELEKQVEKLTNKTNGTDTASSDTQD